jgi:chemotaxis regulatin CheY-phosphate phosphatase CheZ
MNKSEDRKNRGKQLHLKAFRDIMDKLQKLARQIPAKNTSMHAQLESIMRDIEDCDGNVYENFVYGIRFVQNTEHYMVGGGICEGKERKRKGKSLTVPSSSSDGDGRSSRKSTAMDHLDTTSCITLRDDLFFPFRTLQ